jgi:hypothetical protein
MVRNPVRQVGIEQAFTDRPHEIRWIDFARGPAPALTFDEGLILDSRNTILLERPSPSSVLNSKSD